MSQGFTLPAGRQQAATCAPRSSHPTTAGGTAWRSTMGRLAVHAQPTYGLAFLAIFSGVATSTLLFFATHPVHLPADKPEANPGGVSRRLLACTSVGR